VDPTIYLQGRGTQAPFRDGIGTCMGETHPYGVQVPFPQLHTNENVNYIIRLMITTNYFLTLPLDQ
jgi:hypothetical protein